MEGCSSTSAEIFKHYEPSSAQHDKKYHVFLSFRGMDVRKTLVDHLYQSLCTAGLHVFLDSEKLEKGEKIGVSLEEAIRNSTIHIPIFSADYASSAWCLDELSLIWSCKSTSRTTIIPLFYSVEPSDVRYPDKKGPYAKAFEAHRGKNRHSENEMDAWKEALHQVSHLSGWSLSETVAGYEGRLVKVVVMDLLKTLNITSLHVAKHPEGLSDRLAEVTTLLKMDDHSQPVLTVGIWGMGGLGKTTLAKAVYNCIHLKFEAYCFMPDVRASTEKQGLLDLQKQILQNLANVDKSNLEKWNSVDHVLVQMKSLLRSKKVLVILDDVDEEKQLDALVGDGVNGYCFGPGSRIIVTTRDSQVLQRQADKIMYKMRGLDGKEGVKLFCWHAFLRAGPPEVYKDITEKTVNACQGLPLSLEVVGAHLYDEKSLEIWNEAVNNLVKNHKKVYKTLKISYDALLLEEKCMFLDIACFFTRSWFVVRSRYDMEFYVKLWKDLKFTSPRTCLRNLERKSLITIDNDSTYRYGPVFWMHDHLRDMAREIIEKETRSNPAKSSRFWGHQDLVGAMAQTQKLPKVEGLVLDFYQEQEKQDDFYQTYHSAYPWEVMRNLKFMFISGLCHEGRLTKLPPNLLFLGIRSCRFQEDESASNTEPISFCLPKTI